MFIIAWIFTVTSIIAIGSLFFALESDFWLVAVPVWFISGLVFGGCFLFSASEVNINLNQKVDASNQIPISKADYHLPFLQQPMFLDKSAMVDQTKVDLKKTNFKFEAGDQVNGQEQIQINKNILSASDTVASSNFKINSIKRYDDHQMKYVFISPKPTVDSIHLTYHGNMLTQIQSFHNESLALSDLKIQDKIKESVAKLNLHDGDQVLGRMTYDQKDGYVFTIQTINGQGDNS